MSLGKILHPIGVKAFLGTYFEQRSLLIRGRRHKLADVFDRDAFDHILRGELYRDGGLKAVFVNTRAEHVEVPDIPPHLADHFVNAGMTLCAWSIERAHAGLAALAGSIERELASGGRFRLNCYVSPKGSGFGTHFDDASALILHLGGEKEWWFGAAPAVSNPRHTVVLPPRGPAVSEVTGAVIARPRDRELRRVVLRPGDVLYLPAGTWHSTRAVSDCIALTLTEPRMIASQLASAAFQTAVGECPSGRTAVPMFTRRALQRGRVPHALAQLCEAQAAELQRASATIDTTALLRSYYRRLDAALVPQTPAAPTAQRPPERTHRFRRTATRPWVYFHTGTLDDVYFYWGGRELRLPSAVQPILAAIEGGRTFSAGWLTRW